MRHYDEFPAEHLRFRAQMFQEKRQRMDSCERVLRQSPGSFRRPLPPNSAWMTDLFGFGNVFTPPFSAREILDDDDSLGGIFFMNGVDTVVEYGVDTVFFWPEGGIARTHTEPPAAQWRQVLARFMNLCAGRNYVVRLDRFGGPGSVVRRPEQMFRDQHGPPTSPEERGPADHRPIMHRALENVDCLRFGRLEKTQQQQWVALADSHRQLNGLDVVGDFLNKGRTLWVCAVGRTSEQGRALNGQIGRVTRVQETSQPKRYGIVFDSMGRGADPVALRAENLKTPNGVRRTNEFPGGLFSRICRINHSCNRNAALQTSDFLRDENGRFVETVLARRAILRGEELTLSYSVNRDEPRQWQRDLLRIKYGFMCECEVCRGEERQ